MAKKIPFEYVLEELSALKPQTKPMFGCHAVYSGDKILIILRQRDDHIQDNGIWIATDTEHHDSLKKEFPAMRSIHVLSGGGETKWQNLPLDQTDFEEKSYLLCKLLLQKDKRIGKIPKSRRKVVKSK